MKKLLSIILLTFVTTVYAFPITAYFTGRQEMVTTVTHEVMWECYYTYSGHQYTRLFKNSCPHTIEVI
jgi:hypothetical protein